MMLVVLGIGKVRWLYSVAAAVMVVAVGCTLPRTEPDLTATDPTAKIPAIRNSAAGPNGRTISLLIEELDSDDPAIRFYAIRALQQITGETRGYRYFDDDLERRPAVRAWREWWAQETGVPLPDSGRFAPASAPATEPSTTQ